MHLFSDYVIGKWTKLREYFQDYISLIQFILQTATEEEQKGKRKKQNEEELLLQNYIKKYMYESRTTEIMIITIFILTLATI